MELASLLSAVEFRGHWCCGWSLACYAEKKGCISAGPCEGNGCHAVDSEGRLAVYLVAGGWTCVSVLSTDISDVCCETV